MTGDALLYIMVKPPIAIAYGPAPDRRLAVPPIVWLAQDFQLIRSGDGRHEELGDWPLISRQGGLAL